MTQGAETGHAHQLEKLEEAVAGERRGLLRGHREQVGGWLTAVESRLEALRARLAEEEGQM